MSIHAAYLRRSYVDADSPGDISEEAQRSTVRRLARGQGHQGDLVEYNDWGVSADIAKSGKRTQYTQLLEDMQTGKVAAVYAFDVDRLYRDPRDLVRLQDAAQRHRVKIVTTSGTLAIGEGDDPSAEAFAFIGAVFGRLELQKSKKRARAAVEVRKARGDSMGHPAYGWKSVRDDAGHIRHIRDEEVDVEPIRAAYLEAGTVLGAVHLLNGAVGQEVRAKNGRLVGLGRGLPAPKGGIWHTSAVTRVVERTWPDLLPKANKRGRRVAPSMTLSQLLRCHCGVTLTPNNVRNQYYCSAGHVTPGHGQYTVQEKYLLPFVRAKVDGLRLPGDKVKLAAENEARRLAADARLERARELYMAGDLTKAEYDGEKAKSQRTKADLVDTLTMVDLPPIDWDTATPEQLNRLLRVVIEHVQLGTDLRPVPDGIKWRGRIGEWAQ